MAEGDADSSSFIINPRKKDSAQKTGPVEEEEEGLSVDENYAVLCKQDEDGLEPTAEELTDDGEDWNEDFFHHQKEAEKDALNPASSNTAQPTPAVQEEDLDLKAIMADDNSPGSHLWKLHFGETVST